MIKYKALDGGRWNVQKRNIIYRSQKSTICAIWYWRKTYRDSNPLVAKTKIELDTYFQGW